MLLQVPRAIQLRPFPRPTRLKRANLRLHLQGQTNIVQALDGAILAELGDVERGKDLTVITLDNLVDGVYFDFLASLSLPGDTLKGSLIGDYNGQHSVLEGVVGDVCKRRDDDAINAEVERSPGSVLATGAATKVGPGNGEDLGMPVRLLVKDEIGLLRSVGVEPQSPEQGASEPRALDRFEELLVDDGIRVEICHAQGDRNALQCGEGRKTGRGSCSARSRGIGSLLIGGDVVKLLQTFDVDSLGIGLHGNPGRAVFLLGGGDGARRQTFQR